MKKNFTKQDFNNMLRPNGDCLEWTGAKDFGHYGLTYVNGKMIKTHRLALELQGIDIANQHVLHSCHNPSCCNPKHLRVGTHQDNMRDRCVAKRTAVGIATNRNKLSEHDVFNIRKEYKNGQGVTSIARQYNVSQGNISAIVSRKTWTHI